MDQDTLNQRLSRISTLWTLIQRAHATPADVATAARQLLLQRYCGASYHYLLGAVRDEDAALELFQEFALRFMRGDFHRASPGRGRFRDYLRTALINLVHDHHRQRKARDRPLPADVAQPATLATEDLWLESWRSELLTRAWAALAEAQPAFFTVLMRRVQIPEEPSADLAKHLSAELGKPFTSGNARVTLTRAREKFAALLVQEVECSLESSEKEKVLKELHELRLLAYCEPALKKRAVSGS